ncbi:hypothetical protein E1292_35295 [Nonomuraea deserti]|uniref:Uncharacterized protein n=1 Tax=Nonomuraea deserti TaxID=1848322 RepID=A0A4V6PCG5_9ACTN|nr:hypothetical protein [Nonomuraea deserti]TDC98505.1 hypothetical protein E1292_35295 [Nonomuraea deserti]
MTESRSVQAAAKLMNISERSVRHAMFVRKHGIPELEQMVMAGTLTISAAAMLAEETPERQREVIATTPPRKIRALLTRERPANVPEPDPCPHCNGTGRKTEETP